MFFHSPHGPFAFSSPDETSLMSSSDLHVIWFPHPQSICIILLQKNSTLLIYLSVELRIAQSTTVVGDQHRI